MAAMKVCSKCKILLNEEKFTKDRNKKDGLSCSCIECRNATYIKYIDTRNKYNLVNKNEILRKQRERSYKKTGRRPEDKIKETIRKCRGCEQLFELSNENFWPTKDGFQYHCKDCHRIKATEWMRLKMSNPETAKIEKLRSKQYREENKEQRTEYAKKRNLKLRKSIFAYYGEICIWCGEDDYNALTIDHIENNGHAHRLEIGKGKALYPWLIKQEFPDGFQTLCWNCNMTKHFNGGILSNHRKDKYKVLI